MIKRILTIILFLPYIYAGENKPSAEQIYDNVIVPNLKKTMQDKTNIYQKFHELEDQFISNESSFLFTFNPKNCMIEFKEFSKTSKNFSPSIEVSGFKFSNYSDQTINLKIFIENNFGLSHQDNGYNNKVDDIKRYFVLFYDRSLKIARNASIDDKSDIITKLILQKIKILQNCNIINP